MTKKLYFMFVVFMFSFSLFFYSCSRHSSSYKKRNYVPAKSTAVPKHYVNIGIILNASSISAGSSEHFFISDSGGKKIKFSKGYVKLELIGQNVKIGQHIFKLPLKIEPSNKVIFANSKPYRGYLTVLSSTKGLDVINILTLEDYLKGVVPREMPAYWGTEALKAQSVISRTYTIVNLNKHSAQGFNLCSTSHCQVYEGVATEKKSSNESIYKTQGEILIYDNKPAQTFFHSTCGGHTDSPEFVWGAKNFYPYLKGVKCDCSSSSPHNYWLCDLNENFIRQKLSNYRIGKIKNISIKNKTYTGAAKNVIITHSEGKLVLNAYKFRLLVDAGHIKSHLFTSIKKKGNVFSFEGKGWGHKVGLCQWGAKSMAEKGKSYRQILQHYYPDTELKSAS
jgi:stage II sporulation protein D